MCKQTGKYQVFVGFDVLVHETWLIIDSLELSSMSTIVQRRGFFLWNMSRPSTWSSLITWRDVWGVVVTDRRKCNREIEARERISFTTKWHGTFPHLTLVMCSALFVNYYTVITNVFSLLQRHTTFPAHFKTAVRILILGLDLLTTHHSLTDWMAINPGMRKIVRKASRVDW